MSAGGFPPEARHRLLHDPAVRAQRPHRHPQLGRLLDQHRRHSGQSDHWSADSTDNDHAVHGRQVVPAQGLLYQGHRRVDVGVLNICIHVAAGVRSRQRVFKKRSPRA